MLVAPPFFTMSETLPPPPRPVPEHFVQQRKDWWRAYKIWIAIHWLLSAAATIAAVLAAALKEYAPIFGSIAAVASALIGVGYPQRQSVAYSRAHRRLNRAYVAYQHDEKVTVHALLRGQNEGEKIIEGAETNSAEDRVSD